MVENADRIAVFVWDVHVRFILGDKPGWLRVVTNLLQRYSPALCYLVIRKIELEQKVRIEKIIEFREKMMAVSAVDADRTLLLEEGVVEGGKSYLPLEIHDESPVIYETPSIIPCQNKIIDPSSAPPPA